VHRRVRRARRRVATLMDREMPSGEGVSSGPRLTRRPACTSSGSRKAAGSRRRGSSSCADQRGARDALRYFCAPGACRKSAGLCSPVTRW
jgi:hypothetical protein